jgi:hypothetical protein
MYRPIVAMEVAAVKATAEPSEGRERQKASRAASQTARTGERNLSSTLWKKLGCGNMSVWVLPRGEGDAYDATISRKREHHPRITGHGKQAAMPYANHDQAHQDHRAVVAEYIDEDLQHRLPIVTRHGPVEVLDPEEETEKDEHAEQGAEAHRTDHAKRCAPGGVPRLLREMGRSIEAGQRILGHQRAAAGDIRRAGSHAPSIIPLGAGLVVEGRKNELGALVRRCLCQHGDGDGRHARRVQEDGGIVQIAQDVDTEGIDQAMGDQNSGVDADGPGGRGNVGGLDSCGGRDQTCQPKGNTCGHSNLAKEVEPIPGLSDSFQG